MYKIYINDTPLLLIRQAEGGLPPAAANELIARYPGKSKFLLHYVNMLEHTRRWDRIGLYSPDLEGMWRDFQKHFTVQEYAGAAVFDERGCLLFKVEDPQHPLPQGPIKPGLSPGVTALEVAKAQTGWESLSIAETLAPTYHTASAGKPRRLIKTHWFRVQLSPAVEKVTPPFFEWIKMSFVRSRPDFIPTYLSDLLGAGRVFD